MSVIDLATAITQKDAKNAARDVAAVRDRHAELSQNLSDFTFQTCKSPCKPDRADSLQGALRSWDRIRCHGSEGSALGPKVIIYHMVKQFRERGFFLCGSPMAPDEVFFSHLQAVQNSTELLNSTKPRRANRSSQGSRRSWAQGAE